jgi:hypothetical protein
MQRFARAAAVAAFVVSLTPSAFAQTFDIKAYCKQVSAAVGGSYQIEATCRGQEEAAQRALAAQAIPPEIDRYCTEVARSVGGSYQIKQTCVAQEKAAKSGLE